MYRRSLPPFPDLSAFLAYLDGKDGVRTITAPVDMNLEITEVHRRVIAAGGPVLRFERAIAAGGPRPWPWSPICSGRGSAWRRGSAQFRPIWSGLARSWPGCARRSRPGPSRRPGGCSRLRARPCNRARNSSPSQRPGRMFAPDFSQLPVQTCWPGDAGPLITWPIVITRAPGDDDASTYNLGIYRMQVLDKDAAIMRWLPMRGGAAHHRQWAARGLETPVAVVIGADPATILAAVMPAPEGVSELALAGLLGGRRPELAPCRTIPLHVPASAQIVLEGAVSPTETAMEGPFGDHTGYYNPPEPFPVFRLKHMRIREPGMYLTTFTGRAPDEPSVIADAMLDIFKPLLRQQLPEILDVWLPPEACSYRIAVLAIDKRYPGQARRAMMGFWSLLPQFTMTKILVAVDADIDIRSWSDVMWAVATRMDPSRDLMILDRTPIDHLDFASPLTGLGGKLGIDATKKIGSETTRGWGEVMRMSGDVEARVAARWGELFPEPPAR